MARRLFPGRNFFRIAAPTCVLPFVLGATLWTRCGMRGCPDVDRLANDIPDHGGVIVDRLGQEIMRLPPVRRVRVRIDSLPDYVPAAFVAMEDQRFWRHHGIDWHRVAGAAYHNLRELGIEQGSSTITMQLARNVFPDRLPASQRTMSRKFAEARVAQLIEDKYSKRQILEMYLNQIYFGHGAYGIEAAAREYFGKHASQLTLDQAALLAGLPRAPSVLNPRSNFELAMKGRRLVLSRMVAARVITSGAAAAAAKVPVHVLRGAMRPDLVAPYFVQAVRQVLEDSLSDPIDSDGYTVVTTLDSRLQRIVEDEVSRQLESVESGAYGRFDHPTFAAALRDSVTPVTGTDYLQAAVVFMDPRSGEVRAMIGGRDYDDSQFNRAVSARRQVASTFKPFVYAAAVAAGYPPSLKLSDEPLRIGTGKQAWSPQNEDGLYHDTVTMRQALASSSNVATVRLGTMVGLGRVAAQAQRAGFHGPIPSVPSMVLGSAEASPLEVTAAYATLANLGKQTEPRLVTRVLDAHGKVVWERAPIGRAALDPAVAFVVTEMLKDVVDSGTGVPVRNAGYRGVAAGKTGTSNAAMDLWFVGYTPQLVGTIWLGFDRRTTILPNAHSGDIAAPIWGRVMARLGDTTADWQVPPGVVARRIDGAGRAIALRCGKMAMRTEYFLARAAPVPTC